LAEGAREFERGNARDIQDVKNTPAIHGSTLAFELRSSACGADVCTAGRECGERSRLRLTTGRARVVCGCSNTWRRRVASGHRARNSGCGARNREPHVFARTIVSAHWAAPLLA
jgi:hypothetical protein